MLLLFILFSQGRGQDIVNEYFFQIKQSFREAFKKNIKIFTLGGGGVQHYSSAHFARHLTVTIVSFLTVSRVLRREGYSHLQDQLQFLSNY